MKNIWTILTAALACLISARLVAQAPATASNAVPAGAIASAGVSPEVHADRSVTIRLNAPKASEVMLKGDWFDGTKPFTQNERGVWTLTLAPMPPASYIYNLIVDGMTIADPANPQVKLRQQGQGSFFNIGGESPGVADVRDVPHGIVHTVIQKSVALGDTRAFLVYTPPGYEEARDLSYPVLYLLHGHNDRPQGWVDVGHINHIADNLLSEKKMEPMIIVLPPTHALPIEAPAAGTRNPAVFEEYLLKDVLPAVEARYRVAAGRPNRAIAGFSMGGALSRFVFTHHVDKFSAIGMFSPGSGRDLAATSSAFAEVKASGLKIDAFYLACGQQDSLFASVQALHDILTKLDIVHTWRSSEGYHNFALWRQHAIEFLPLLFRAK
jgi:enterochelin esterase-like enzyme